MPEADGGPVVVVAEDDDDVRAIIRTALEAEGCRVLVAGDGRAALELVAGHDPDLLVLDLVMPLVSGLDVLRELRRVGRKRPPVLVLTARTDGDDVAACRALGAADYVTKPFLLDDVRRLVRTLLGRRQA